MAIDRELLQAQISNTIKEYNLPSDLIPIWGKRIEGKVRDCFVHGDTRVIVASDRLSAFDVVLTTIPFKGQLLTQLASYWFKLTKHIIPNHVIAQPHPNVLLCREVSVLPIEVIVRGYITGSAWRDYQAGKPVSGIKLPSGLRRSERLSKPLLTPSTKAERGHHDQPISCEEILNLGLVDAEIWRQVETKAIELFNFGSQKSLEQGLILVDTKYEFGVATDANGKKQLILADEIHTLDSSRFWVSETYSERFNSGSDPDMLDKEFVRRELMSRGFMGDGPAPVLSDDFRVETAERYINAYEKITGSSFRPELGGHEADISQSIRSWTKTHFPVL